MDRIYSSYCGGKSGLDGARFLKLCKDTKLFSPPAFRPEDLDVIFAKFKEPGQRVMSFEGFMAALEAIAQRKRTSFGEVIAYIEAVQPSNQPRSGTVAQANRFYDDTNTYTGVHKAGGPTIIDHQKQDLSKMIDRNVNEAANPRRIVITGSTQSQGRRAAQGMNDTTPAVYLGDTTPVAGGISRAGTASWTLRDLSHVPQSTFNEYQTSPVPGASPRSSSPGRGRIPVRASTAPPAIPEAVDGGLIDVVGYLKLIFQDYASRATMGSGSGGIDGAKFLKFNKDAKIINASYRPEDVDIVFAKYKEGGGLRFMTFDGFLAALTHIAQRKRMSMEAMLEHIMRVQPRAEATMTGTRAQANRFYDDVSTYTGVHKAGGPTIIDYHKQDLSKMINRQVNESANFKRPVMDGSTQSISRKADAPLQSMIDARKYGAVNEGLSRAGSLMQNSGYKLSRAGSGQMTPPAAPGTRVRQGSSFDVTSPEALSEDMGRLRVGERAGPGPVGSSHGRAGANGSIWGSGGPGQHTAQVGDPIDMLKPIFKDYSSKAGSAGSGLDGARFLKFCKDSRLVSAGGAGGAGGSSSSFRPEDVDVMFAKNKEPGQRFVAWNGFYNCICLIAAKKRSSVEQVVGHILQVGPRADPTSATVVAQPNKFHDDHTSYTGVHKVGGPTNIDRHNLDLSVSVNRGPGMLHAGVER